MPQRAVPPRPPAASRPTAAARGYDRQWRKARLVWLAEHPLCEHCLAEERVTPATVVDHRIDHQGQADPLFWDRTNWQSLCKSHHDRKTLGRES